MDRLQLIDPDAKRADRLRRWLEDLGWHVQVATCAQSARAALALHRPTVVLVHSLVEGLDPARFVAPADDAQAGAPLWMICFGAAGAETPGQEGFDLTITSEEPSEIVGALGTSRPAPPRPHTADGNPHPRCDVPPEADSLRLEDVLEELLDADVSGRLTIHLHGSQEAHSVFVQDGQIEPESIEGLGGDEALAGLLDACQKGRGFWFRLERFEGPPPSSC